MSKKYVILRKSMFGLWVVQSEHEKGLDACEELDRLKALFIDVTFKLVSVLE